MHLFSLHFVIGLSNTILKHLQLLGLEGYRLPSSMILTRRDPIVGMALVY